LAEVHDSQPLDVLLQGITPPLEFAVPPWARRSSLRCCAIS